jgi:hypothetical protein
LDCSYAVGRLSVRGTSRTNGPAKTFLRDASATRPAILLLATRSVNGVTLVAAGARWKCPRCYRKRMGQRHRVLPRRLHFGGCDQVSNVVPTRSVRGVSRQRGVPPNVARTDEGEGTVSGGGHPRCSPTDCEVRGVTTAHGGSQFHRSHRYPGYHFGATGWTTPLPLTL